MGKVTLAVLVLAVALGVYWFWWSDQGANDPITIDGSLSISGLSGLPGMSGMPRSQGPIKVDFTLQAVPNKVRISGTIEGQKGSAIFRLDKRELYLLDDKKNTYTSVEFDFVDVSETELYEAEETWPKELKRTPDWDYIGTGDDSRFCNKQTVADLSKDLAKQAKDIPLLPLILALSKQAKVELWFTPETRLGKRYFSMINKLARIRPMGKTEQLGMFDFNKALQEKRGQLKYVNLDFFPIPMKANLSFGPARFNLELSSLSRKKIPKDTFEIPSGYKEE